VPPVENRLVGKAGHRARKGSLTHLEGGRAEGLGPASFPSSLFSFDPLILIISGCVTAWFQPEGLQSEQFLGK